MRSKLAPVRQRSTLAAAKAKPSQAVPQPPTGGFYNGSGEEHPIIRTKSVARSSSARSSSGPTSAPVSKAGSPATDWVRVGTVTLSPREKSERACLTPREKVVPKADGPQLTEDEIQFLNRELGTERSEALAKAEDEASNYNEFGSESESMTRRETEMFDELDEVNKDVPDDRVEDTTSIWKAELAKLNRPELFVIIF